jgi:hypothetical protein
MRVNNGWTNLISNLGEDREYDHRAQIQHDPASDRRLRRDRRHGVLT